MSKNRLSNLNRIILICLPKQATLTAFVSACQTVKPTQRTLLSLNKFAGKWASLDCTHEEQPIVFPSPWAGRHFSYGANRHCSGCPSLGKNRNLSPETTCRWEFMSLPRVRSYRQDAPLFKWLINWGKKSTESIMVQSCLALTSPLPSSSWTALNNLNFD